MSPVSGPLLGLLHSRKFIVAVAGILVDIVVVLVPALSEVQNELLAVVTAVISVLIASIAYEDAHKAKG